MGFDDPLKCRDDRRMIDNLAGLQGLLALLDGHQELLLIGDIGSQRLVDELRPVISASRSSSRSRSASTRAAMVTDFDIAVLGYCKTMFTL
jgi:hypothetical protein